MKTRAQIAAETREPIPRPADYRYGAKLPAWDSSVQTDVDLVEWQPLRDNIIVKLVPFRSEKIKLKLIILTDAAPLIGGPCRAAIVLKLGTGKRIAESNERIPFVVKPGDEVLIGNWVDLEADGIVLCSEADVRGKVWRS